MTGTSTFSAAIKVQEPIDLNMEVGGVKLSSVFFDPDKMQAFVILQNRTPIAVTPKVGIALFDAKGKMLATGLDVTAFSFSGEKVSPGDQKNIELSFAKFINEFTNAASFQVVLSLGKVKEPAGGSKPSPVPGF